jgi:hypothetical protein
MPPNREIKIIKVPLSDKERLPDYPQSFPRMPRMYLELLENKAKIKQDLINKEYIPKDGADEQRHEHHTARHEQEKVTDETEIEEKISVDSRDSRNNSRNSVDSDDTHETEDSQKSEVSRHSRVSDDTNESYQSKESPRSRSVSPDLDTKSEVGDRTVEAREKSNSSDDLSVRLKELLGESNDTRSQYEHSPKKDKYSRGHKQSVEIKASRFTPYEKYKQDKKVAEHAPTLAELEAKGHYQGKAELRDINHVTTGEYEEEDKKRELMFKFDLLKKSYPTSAAAVPEYTIHSDLREMQKSYDVSVRRLSLDSTVENYKQYLLGGFMLVEFVFGNFLGFDMQGFTQQQIIGMHNYERLLIELGEKSYVPSGSRWPVELRLLFVIIMNAGFFIVGKMILRRTGANLMGMMNSTHTPATSTEIPKQKRRMKGPNINLDNIPDVEEAQTPSPGTQTHPQQKTQGGI